MNLNTIQYNDLLVHLDKINSLLTNTDAKDLMSAKDLTRINNDWRNIIVKCTHPIKLHPTEEKYPEMTTRFKEIQEEMYKVFLDKNMDYSPYNINGTGIVGLCTRFWDKTARIMHLIGFDIGTGIYTGIRKNTVEDEPIEKTFIDGSNYGIIARIYLEGKWGK